MSGREKFPPGPKSLLPVRNFFTFRRDATTFLQHLAEKYGDVVYFKMGPQHVFFLNHPDLVKDVLVTRNDCFVKGRALQRAKRLLGEGLLTSEGEFHRRQKRLALPAFHRQRIATYGRVMTAYGERIISEWRDGVTLDMSEEMMRLTLAIVGKTLFDADVERDAKDVGEALSTIMSLFDAMLLPFSEYLEKLPLPQTRRFEKARDKLDAIIYKIIEERRSSGLDRGDLLSMLLLAQEDEEGKVSEQMTDEQVRDEVMTLFLAGHETTANAMTWTWYLLSQNTEAEKCFHSEVDEVLGERLPTVDDVARLKYTEMVLAESMRLYPPAWALGRLAVKDFQLDGYTIPAGSLILLSQFVMHRDERFFPEAERFLPERWAAAEREARPQYSYFPFGGGPRRCIGESFAWMEGVLLLATIARKWRMRLAPNHRVELQPVITLRPKHGMRMIVERRR